MWEEVKNGCNSTILYCLLKIPCEWKTPNCFLHGNWYNIVLFMQMHYKETLLRVASERDSMLLYPTDVYIVPFFLNQSGAYRK